MATTTTRQQTRAVKAQEAAMAAPPSSQTQSKTIGAANAAHRRFTCMENDVQQALCVCVCFDLWLEKAVCQFSELPQLWLVLPMTS